MCSPRRGLSEDVIVQASAQRLVGPISDPNYTGHGDASQF